MGEVKLIRHIYKTISYRILGTLQTVIFGYLLTGNILIASTLGITEILVKPLLYFVHERIWYKWIKLGLKNKNEKNGNN